MESRLASLHHELDVLSKLKAQADGSTTRVRLLTRVLPCVLIKITTG